ncbi:hypothetical protein DCCM_2921 [Desulfocucumis palustris]|uniref:Uncharacterized protein n=1 Tax=Desulfocucumis palustris TaxID=1898651 RepID=A0A2L2XCD8_9FIRM|nr:hypothetical protein DCCM_2921 [Desulfocucumis palustris]
MVILLVVSIIISAFVFFNINRHTRLSGRRKIYIPKNVIKTGNRIRNEHNTDSARGGPAVNINIFPVNHTLVLDRSRREYDNVQENQNQVDYFV